MHGPFPFARGPLYFLSAALVGQLLGDAWVSADFNRTLSALAQHDELRRQQRRRMRARGAADHTSPPPVVDAPSMVWEDVYTGYLLSRVINATDQPRLALVENGVGNGGANPVYTDGWGMQLAPTTLIWHMRTKRRAAHRVAYAHHWLEVERRHCMPPPSSGPLVRCGWHTARAMTTACTGARWLRCTSRRESFAASNCSTALTELKRAAGAWLDARERARIQVR